MKTPTIEVQLSNQNLYNYALTTMVHTQLFPTFYLFLYKKLTYYGIFNRNIVYLLVRLQISL